MLLSIIEVVYQAKKQLEELTNKTFVRNVNVDRRTFKPNNYYFLSNEELDIKIVISYRELNGATNEDSLLCEFESPILKKNSFDFRSIYAGDSCVKYILDMTKGIIKE